MLSADSKAKGKYAPNYLPSYTVQLNLEYNRPTIYVYFSYTLRTEIMSKQHKDK